jgi:hypothetical protein
VDIRRRGFDQLRGFHFCVEERGQSPIGAKLRL